MCRGGEMSQLQDMKEYIYCINRPFTKRQIEKDLELQFRTVKVYLQQLLRENYIKIIGIDKQKTVYIYNTDKGLKQRKYRTRQKHYTLEHIQERYRRQLVKEEKDKSQMN
jgi:hypothetical protein